MLLRFLAIFALAFQPLLAVAALRCAEAGCASPAHQPPHLVMHAAACCPAADTPATPPIDDQPCGCCTDEEPARNSRPDSRPDSRLGPACPCSVAPGCDRPAPVERPALTVASLHIADVLPPGGSPMVDMTLGGLPPGPAPTGRPHAPAEGRRPQALLCIWRT